MKKENKNDKKAYREVPNLMFQDVKIPEPLAPTPLNPGLDVANQLNIPRNPGPAIHALDWAVPGEPLVIAEEVPPTPNPHTNPKEDKKKK